MPPVRNGPQLTWTNVIGTLGFGTLLIASFMGAFWTVFQTQFANTERRMERLEKERSDFVGRDEHREFVKRLDGDITQIQQQLLRIETTRPTTGELKQLGDSAAEQARKLDDRVRSLEDYLRTVRPIPSTKQ
jgi:uncharacterized protein HemX